MKLPFITIPTSKFLENSKASTIFVSFVSSNMKYLFFIVNDADLYSVLSKCVTIPISFVMESYGKTSTKITNIVIIDSYKKIFDYFDDEELKAKDDKDEPYIEYIQPLDFNNLKHQKHFYDQILFSNHDKEIESWLKLTFK